MIREEIKLLADLTFFLFLLACPTMLLVKVKKTGKLIRYGTNGSQKVWFSALFQLLALISFDPA